MNSRTILLIFSILVTISSYSQSNKWYGKWEVTQVEDLQNERVNKRPKGKRNYLFLQEEGILEGGGGNRDPHRTGSWSYDKIENIFTIESETDKQGSGNYSVLKFSRKKLIIENSEY
jgi:hypothetical protein